MNDYDEWLREKARLSQMTCKYCGSKASSVSTLPPHHLSASSVSFNRDSCDTTFYPDYQSVGKHHWGDQGVLCLKTEMKNKFDELKQQVETMQRELDQYNMRALV